VIAAGMRIGLSLNEISVSEIPVSHGRIVSRQIQHVRGLHVEQASRTTCSVAKGIS
jgi:hypothetical protein